MLPELLQTWLHAQKLYFWVKIRCELSDFEKLKVLDMLWSYYDLAQGGRYVARRDDFAFPRLISTQRVAKKLGFRVKTNREMLVYSKTNCKHILIDRNMPL